MAAISSKVAGRVENKFKFNGGSELQSEEFSDLSGLELYDAKYRLYDVQIGRFHQIDPLADLSLSYSPYLFSSNNPILRNDPLGLKDSSANYKLLPEIIIKAVRKAKNWFTGANVGYNGSGWGHGPRQWAANKIGLSGYANNLIDLGLHSQFQTSYTVTIGGNLLDQIKRDPDMIAFQNRIIKLLKADARFGKMSFVIARAASETEGVEFGGKRAQGEMMDQLKDPFNPAYSATWKVASNELTWALRHSSIAYTALAKADGTIIIGYELTDKFDLRPSANHTEAYNKVTSVVGPLYHDVTGGNDQMKVQAHWEATIK